MSQFLRAPRGIAAGRDAVTINLHAPVVAGDVVVHMVCPGARECEALAGYRRRPPEGRALARSLGALLRWVIDDGRL